MIWLTWRQFRASAALTAAALAALTAVLALTGPGLSSQYAAGIADCVADDTCDRFFDVFFDHNQLAFLAVSLVVLALPALIGLFWGAPLITRELETGTHLLVWSQSVTRVRWLTIKLGLIGLTAMTAACLCGLVVTWWSGPLDKSAVVDLAQMAPLVFGARGIVPVGYAAFAVVLGVTVGMLVRRTLPAMALTLAAFVVIQLAMPLLVRPHLMPPVTGTFELGHANIGGISLPADGAGIQISTEPAVPGHPGAWVLSSDLVDASGRTIGGNGQETTIPVSSTSGPCAPQGGPPNEDPCWAEINQLGYRQRASYQPLERFWPFQWIETGIYAALALGLTGLCFWLIRRRVS
ncbi:ABC transporter permease [Streptosporangiaceae bacterium NEAU-GS5]|nr:ABC transporter permease [Streptosporangiaceae bacterium NEAU-GS5]